MTCPQDGVFRAYLDRELVDREWGEVTEHLASCPACRARLEALQAEMAQTANLLARLAPPEGAMETNPKLAYAQFATQFEAAEAGRPWMARLFAPRWRAAWGLAAAMVVVAMVIGLNPVRTWAQRILAMLRVQKIAVVSIDPGTLLNSGELDSRPYRLINQFIADNVVVTLDPGKPDRVSSPVKAGQLAGYRVLSLGSLPAPQMIEVRGETAFEMTLDRNRVQTLLDELGRSDIHIPESTDGALVAVHIPSTVVSMYGNCPLRPPYRKSGGRWQAEPPEQRKMEGSANDNQSCTYLIQAPSPTVSVPPDLNMSEIAEAALELVGMSPGEARAFCQTVDWSSTLVIPIPRDSTSYETVPVDGVEGTLITENSGHGHRYSLLWIKNGMIHSLAGQGDSSDALALAASLR
jgi:hypothetical protein